MHPRGDAGVAETESNLLTHYLQFEKEHLRVALELEPNDGHIIGKFVMLLVQVNQAAR